MGVEGGWGGGGHELSMSKDDHATFTVVENGSTTTFFSANPAIPLTLIVSSLCLGMQGEWARFKRQQKGVVLFAYYCSMTTVLFLRCHTCIS